MEPPSRSGKVTVAGGSIKTMAATPPAPCKRDPTMEFMTPDERLDLIKRLEQFKANRPELSRRIAEARAHGDLRENADYHAAREEQGLAEAEIRRLEQRLKTAKVTDDSHVPDGMVFVGTVVRLKDTADGSEDLYRLVGEASGNFDADEIEVTSGSPMGEALLKTRVGDIVKVDLPRGERRFEVVQIM